MAHTALRLVSGCSIAFALLLGSGCGKDDDASDDNGDESSGSEGSASATMTASATDTDGMTSMTATMTATMTDTMTSAEDSSGSGDDVSTFEDSGTTEPPMPMPNGSMCTEDPECESGHCFVVGILGGICGDCNTDADCADTTMGGCTIPNPLSQPPQGATCNMGEHGAGCMTDDVCEDPFICAEILNVPGVLVASTCSECTADAECMDGTLCSPSYDVLMLSGSKDCVEPGTVADGTGCDFEGSGDMACESGHCAVADVMGLLSLGVCSPCEVDTDCGPMETCEAPSVDLAMGLIAGACVPM